MRAAYSGDMVVDCPLRFRCSTWVWPESNKFCRQNAGASHRSFRTHHQRINCYNLGICYLRCSFSGISPKFAKWMVSCANADASSTPEVADQMEEKWRADKADAENNCPGGAYKSNTKSRGQTKGKEDDDEPFSMTNEERWKFRRQIRQVMDENSDIEEDMDPEERRKMIEKLLVEYPLVVDEEDPDWPEDAEGRGFNFDQFFNKITIKNVRKDDDDYDSDKELVWQDDDYIRPIRDITTKEWEKTVFKDISPLVILVHNRYRRPQENEKLREELEEGVKIFWDSRLPSPRCVAIDAVVETELVSVLKVSVFPELIFTKAGKILYREREIRTADELSRIMAFFYYGANRPQWFKTKSEESQELIPSLT